MLLGNEYQEVMELDLRYMEPCLVPNGNYVPSFEKLLRKVPHHHMHAGCPVVALREVTEEKELVLFAYGLIDTNTLHALAFNDVSLEDDEALQQEPHTHSFRHPCEESVDCLLSERAAETPDI